MTQESIDKKDVNMRLKQMKNALDHLDKKFKTFEDFGTRMLTFREFGWILISKKRL